MLDTHARRHVQPVLEASATLLQRLGATPNQVTAAAFILGLSAGPLAALGHPWAAIPLLWFSGYLDTLDGTLARRTGAMSAWGTVLDITFDRMVEAGVLLGLATRFVDARLALIWLFASILFSNVIFLVVGALSEKRGMKSFYYQAGLLERTEGFVLLTLMLAFTGHLVLLTYLFVALETFTGLQRLREAHQMLGRQ